MTAVLPDIHPQGRYTPTQAARLLDVSRPTLYSAMRSGELKFTCARDRSRRYIKGAEIRRFYLTH